MPISNLSSGSRPGVCTSTTRPTAPFEGQMIYETDTNRVLVWDNAAWVMIADTNGPPALQKITPTSVTGTGASVDSTGDVVVTNGGSNFVINGAFVDAFANYKVIIRDFKSSGSSGLSVSLGTARTGTAHRYAGLYGSTSATITGFGGNTTNFWDVPIVARTTTPAAGEMTIFGPKIAAPTTMTCHAVDSDAGAVLRVLTGYHTDSTAYSALYFEQSSNSSFTFTSIRVSIYGYR